MARQAQSALIQVRLDESVKNKADALFADLGFDTPTAIRIFLNQAIRRGGMPFEVAKPQPNAETMAAILNGMEILPKRYSSFRELRSEAEAELRAEEADEI
ncbi:MAG: type II toxin-antitoxin system RelB/DinJ family antitoxin [Clostridium sp.]|jgi:DNA-damage-inducible protein J|nr:type II toxin-antitoxin system RelB/DinJ family antitoxin [Clostridium sp.]